MVLNNLVVSSLLKKLDGTKIYDIQNIFEYTKILRMVLNIFIYLDISTGQIKSRMKYFMEN